MIQNALIEHYIQENVPLRHLLNTKPPFMSWRRSAFNEVNDWALNSATTKIQDLFSMIKRIGKVIVVVNHYLFQFPLFKRIFLFQPKEIRKSSYYWYKLMRHKENKNIFIFVGEKMEKWLIESLGLWMANIESLVQYIY